MTTFKKRLTWILIGGFLSLNAGMALGASDFVTKPKLTKKDVQPYVEQMLAEAGDTFIKIHRVVNQPGQAIVFFRFHSRYGRTENRQIVFIKQKESGRWMNRDREDFLTIKAPPG